MPRILEVTCPARVELAWIGPALDAQTDEAYTFVVDGPGRARALFRSIGGEVAAFDLAVTDGGRVHIAVDNLERDYIAAASCAEMLARRYRGAAIDPTIPDPLWPPIGGGDEHPLVATVELAWSIPRAQGALIGPALVEAARFWLEPALPHRFSPAEPFLCDTPGDLDAFRRLCDEQAGGGSLCWTALRPAIGGLASWPRPRAPGDASLKVILARDAFVDDAGRASLTSFARHVTQVAAARDPIVREGAGVTVRLGTWF